MASHDRHVAALVDETIAKGLFAEEAERRYEILETFDDGKELVETVREWTGTTSRRPLPRELNGQCRR